MKRPIAFLGAGNIATALAVILARHKRPINLYCIEGDVESEINASHLNTKYLKDVKLPRDVRAFADPAEALRGADTVIIAVPSFAVSEVMRMTAPLIDKGAIVGCITKGLDPVTLRPIVSTAADMLPAVLKRRMCAIGGPAVAMELAIHRPAGLVVASKDKAGATRLARLLENESLKVAISHDLEGTGYAMALKNVYAVALGMCDGLKYPMNTKALVAWLAMSELATLLKAAKAEPETAFSLSGLGDLLVTGMSPHGRNRTYGERLVGSKTKDPAKLGVMIVEGIPATGLGVKLAKRLKINAPFMQAIQRCLEAKKDFERPFVKYLDGLRLS